MKKLKEHLLIDELGKTPPLDMADQVKVKIENFKILHDLIAHFTKIPIYIFNVNDIEGEENE